MEDKVYVLEGSQCSQLEAHVGPLDDHRLWICKYLVEGPEYVKAMYKDYLNAGSDVLETLTYQVSVQELMEIYSVSVDKAEEIIQSSVKLAKAAWEELEPKQRAKKKEVIIGGAVGPYGALQHDGSEYTGDYVKTVSQERLKEWHRSRVKALVQAEVNFLAFETLPSIVEARALLELLREFPNQKAWISFTCKFGQQTAHGELFGDIISECWRRGRDQILALGCNCTSPELVTSLLQSAKDCVKEPVTLVIYPNSGETFNNGCWSGARQNLGLLAPEWLSLGVKFIGGCCRTDVKDIQQIRKVVDSSNPMSYI